MINIDNYLESHYSRRSNWLRAGLLGAIDGIISISSLDIGIAAASSTREPKMLANVARLVAGALSIAAGEYVSVSSQTDIEKADIEREKKELQEMPEAELQILAQIYEKRGLKKDPALQISPANSLQATLASGAAFTIGGVLPLSVTLFALVKGMEY